MPAPQASAPAKRSLNERPSGPRSPNNAPGILGVLTAPTSPRSRRSNATVPTVNPAMMIATRGSNESQS